MLNFLSVSPFFKALILRSVMSYNAGDITQLGLLIPLGLTVTKGLGPRAF